jgi:hypothetical protein
MSSEMHHCSRKKLRVRTMKLTQFGTATRNMEPSAWPRWDASRTGNSNAELIIQYISWPLSSIFNVPDPKKETPFQPKKIFSSLAQRM